MGDGSHQPGATGLAMPPVSQSHTSWLKNTRGTVIRIEASLAVAAVLLLVQLILGSRRRRSGGVVTQGGLWVAYTLSFPLITNTIGQMVACPLKNPLYIVWAFSLFHILAGTNSAVAYDLDDTKKWIRRLFEQFQYFFFSYSIFLAFCKNAATDPRPDMSLSSTLCDTSSVMLMILLMVGVLLSNLTSILSIWMSNVSNPSKVVADYMKDLVKCKQLSYNNYPVHCGDNYHPVISTDSSYYISKLRESDGIIMMSDIQKYCSGIVFLGSPSGSTTLTNICFSFSLFQLLKRRYFGLLCAEAGTPEALNLVLSGFLPDDRGGQYFPQENTEQISERTFRIVEVQLGFLYDFFFTRHALGVEDVPFLIFVILRIISIILAGVFVCRNSITIPTAIIEVKIQKDDTVITLLVFGILFAVEIVQLALYMVSDWNRVAFACYHAEKKTNANVRKCCNCFRFLRRLIRFSEYWKNEIGQYSILDSGPGYSFATMYLYTQKMHSSFKRMASTNRLLHWTFICIGSVFFEDKSSKKLSPTVRKAIFYTLQSSKGQLTNGESSLMAADQTGRLVTQFKWALDYESQAEIMLIWHVATTYCQIAQSPEVKNVIQTTKYPEVENIETSEEESTAQDHEHIATTYCEIAQSPEVNNIQTTQSPEAENIQRPEEESTAQEDHEVALVLSKYCAYLMAFVPELLPDPEADTKFIFANAVSQAEQVWKLKSNQEKYDAMKKIIHQEDSTDLEEQQEEEQNGYEPIIRRGIRLGELLESKGTVLQWKVLANFWAEKLLYIAPSDNVRGHIEHLAKGGEFLTHVWALLSNAGILNIDRKYYKNRTDA